LARRPATWFFSSFSFFLFFFNFFLVGGRSFPLYMHSYYMELFGPFRTIPLRTEIEYKLRKRTFIQERKEEKRRRRNEIMLIVSMCCRRSNVKCYESREWNKRFRGKTLIVDKENDTETKRIHISPWWLLSSVIILDVFQILLLH